MIIDKVNVKLKETENNTLQTQKNTKKLIINHKGTRMSKDLAPGCVPLQGKLVRAFEAIHLVLPSRENQQNL